MIAKRGTVFGRSWASLIHELGLEHDILDDWYKLEKKKRNPKNRKRDESEMREESRGTPNIRGQVPSLLSK